MKVMFSGTANYFTKAGPGNPTRFYLTCSVEIPHNRNPNWQFPNRAFWLEVEISDDFFWPPETFMIAKFKSDKEA